MVCALRCDTQGRRRSKQCGFVPFERSLHIHRVRGACLRKHALRDHRPLKHSALLLHRQLKISHDVVHLVHENLVGLCIKGGRRSNGHLDGEAMLHPNAPGNDLAAPYRPLPLHLLHQPALPDVLEGEGAAGGVLHHLQLHGERPREDQELPPAVLREADAAVGLVGGAHVEDRAEDLGRALVVRQQVEHLVLVQPLHVQGPPHRHLPRQRSVFQLHVEHRERRPLRVGLSGLGR
mmetsp:Transcript_24477/g.53415  ORF Transcript_24477/g.53415 Transcript_24477/m.53415 type:complete len:235 (+) Transcript_24477:391-1095(+)